MKEQSNGIEIIDVVQEHFANNANAPSPAQLRVPGDDHQDDNTCTVVTSDELESATTAASADGQGSSSSHLGGKKKKKNLAIIASFFVALTVCLGAGVGTRDGRSTATSNAFALQDGNNGPAPRIIGISTELDKDVWEKHRRYLVSFGCSGTLISPRAILTAAREFHV